MPLKASHRQGAGRHTLPTPGHPTRAVAAPAVWRPCPRPSAPELLPWSIRGRTTIRDKTPVNGWEARVCPNLPQEVPFGQSCRHLGIRFPVLPAQRSRLRSTMTQLRKSHLNARLRIQLVKVLSRSSLGVVTPRPSAGLTVPINTCLVHNHSNTNTSSSCSNTSSSRSSSCSHPVLCRILDRISTRKQGETLETFFPASFRVQPGSKSAAFRNL